MAIVKNITFLVNGYDLASALQGFGVSADSEEIDATTVKSTGAFREYVQGFKNGEITANGIFDSDGTNLNKIHDVLSAAYNSGSSQTITASMGTVAVGDPCYMADGSQMTYEVPMDTGALIFANARWRTNEAIRFGRWLASAQLNAGTTNGTAVDNGAATTNGGRLHVHLNNDAATDCDFKLQHSTDNSVWADVSGAAISDLSAANASGSVAFTGTLNRYTRLVSTITGGNTILVSAAVTRG